MTRLYLGIEIGGTKLQLGIGPGESTHLESMERTEVDIKDGAEGILGQIEVAAGRLLQRFDVARIGVGFGGPVDTNGMAITSHQVSGWEEMPIKTWCEQRLKRPTIVVNDCDAAALAEASIGAGRSCRSVFYVTVGTGVGGGWVIDGELQGQGRTASAEIGHLRPGLQADRTDDTVESIASGWGIAARAAQRLAGTVCSTTDSVRLAGPVNRDEVHRRAESVLQADSEFLADLNSRCEGDLEQLSCQVVAQAAADGNQIAEEILRQACRALGWAIAQVVTLIAPQKIVIGGGVSLIGEQHFLNPVRSYVKQYVFPPLAESFEIQAAALGEEVVVHGAILAARKLSHP